VTAVTNFKKLFLEISLVLHPNGGSQLKVFREENHSDIKSDIKNNLRLMASYESTVFNTESKSAILETGLPC